MASIVGSPLEAMVRPAVEKAVDDALVGAIKAAQEQVERDIRKNVASIVMAVLANYDVERSGTVLTIRVQLPEPVKR